MIWAGLMSLAHTVLKKARIVGIPGSMGFLLLFRHHELNLVQMEEQAFSTSIHLEETRVSITLNDRV